MAALAKRSAYVALQGDLDFNSRHEVSACLPDPQAVDDVVMDLREVGYIDSAVVGLLILFRKQFVAAGGKPERIVLVAASGGSVRKVLEITGLPRIFTVTDTLPEME